jgi:8-oxo-dGTP pyrophosphatase MutT (NUDIX family)
VTAGRPPRKRRRQASAGPASGTPKGTGKDSPSGGKAKGRSTTGRGGAPTSSRSRETRTEVSAGGVVYRRGPDGIEVVLAARRTRRGDLAWGLAKGGIEADESAEAAAVREVREETGIEAEIEASLGETHYFYVWESVRIRKTVHFFLMRATGGDPNDRDDEMEDVQWFPLERALKRAAYRGEREVLGRAAEILR